ncbi:carbohydrate sulfotransferase 1-like [Mercenaria mercenaria]|uniref:carbohydrate sulfotransferase 1-like n=1 Tax=Mercenaria mercenaria TaxID=6596 RepID=UPI00234F9F60|nr:carbohydrate sulfotransferase 1-like [Mercenaria mercenaria]
MHNTVLSRKKIVQIVAYMRSGSTLTGSVFQAYPDTFYSFEPLRFLPKAFDELNTIKTHVELKYINGTKRKYSASEKEAVIANEINGWLNCKLESISTLSLKTGLNRHFMKYKSMFHHCSKKYICKSCLQMAIRSCHKTPLVALKFIRLRMKEIAKLLHFYPNMKIVHLVHDPRGIFNSRMNSKAITANNYQTSVQLVCINITEDVKSSKNIQQTYPDKVKILHYEDLAECPLETARSLIEFVGLKFVKSVQNHIEQQTNASHDAGAFNTKRKNSTKTASKWRSFFLVFFFCFGFNAVFQQYFSHVTAGS